MKVLTTINTIAIIALALLVGLTLHELSELKKQPLRVVAAPEPTASSADIVVPAPERTTTSDGISGSWQITHGKEGERKHDVSIEPLGDTRYRLGPDNLVFKGVYEKQGRFLRMVGENPGYPDLAWSRKDHNTYEMVEGDFIGALMRRQ